MSLLPFLLDEVDRPLRLFDQDFGLGLRLNDLYQPVPNLVKLGYYRPWRHVAGQQSGMSSVQADKDGFHVMLDVQQFSPNEISVKTVENCVVVEGKHDEKPDEHGYVSRHFIRRYVLPEGIRPETITSSLSSDGVLSISAPKALPMPAANERMVPITQTGAPALKQQTEPVGSPAAEGEGRKEQ
ncbi:protein lethal(2)essential for life-like [Ischnura elegans]|uniref:protein lethal(2)essential for life-like n=1 Tax=Ischnura elegans TaxID=197161 RepID=UPI001ED8ACC4|nr:protein lethal(2)essential for life-like [Ischnura elegans]